MRRRPPLTLASVAAVAAFSLLAAGCGGGGSAGVASIASSTTAVTTPQTGPVAFTRCMRSHGVPGFPDPDGSGAIPKTQVKAAAQASLGKFNAAQTACNHLLPNGANSRPQQTAQQRRTQLADGLSFAKCMRSHGVTRFPDPTAQGQLPIELVQAQGINVHSPTFLRVVQKCLPASHGALTPAKVGEALDHAGG